MYYVLLLYKKQQFSVKPMEPSFEQTCRRKERLNRKYIFPILDFLHIIMWRGAHLFLNFYIEQ